jgi:hypothetical protein
MLALPLLTKVRSIRAMFVMKVERGDVFLFNFNPGRGLPPEVGNYACKI